MPQLQHVEQQPAVPMVRAPPPAQGPPPAAVQAQGHDPAQVALQRFLDLAQRDAEDEWDSDELPEVDDDDDNDDVLSDDGNAIEGVNPLLAGDEEFRMGNRRDLRPRGYRRGMW
jgi:hypothetical protein